MSCLILVYAWKGASAVGLPSSEISTRAPEAAASPHIAQISRWRNVWRLFTQNRKVSLGFYIVLFFVLVAIFGPLFVTQDPNAFSPDILSPPSPAHWLGTTQTGQDIFAQTVWARASRCLSASRLA